MTLLTTEQLRTLSRQQLEALEAKHGSGLTVASLAQTRVPARLLAVAPQVFQPRDTSEETWKKADHVRDLSAAAKQNGAAGLAKIVVLPVAGLRIVVDGHCRLCAYLWLDPEGKKKVPIEYFKGTVREALVFAAQANSENKLPLSTREKQEMAWRIVLSEEGRPDPLSLRDIQRATGCAKSVVGVMRKQLEERPAGSDDDPRVWPWMNVKNSLRNTGGTPPDDLDEKQVQSFAREARKAHGKRPDKMPLLFYRGLLLAYPVLKEALWQMYPELGEILKQREEASQRLVSSEDF